MNPGSAIIIRAPAGLPRMTQKVDGYLTLYQNPAPPAARPAGAKGWGDAARRSQNLRKTHPKTP